MTEENNRETRAGVRHIAVIFAGGTGERMGGHSLPKQFLQLDGKPVLVYTLEQFQRHEMIDAIILVVLRDWVGHCEQLIAQYSLDKVAAIMAGGRTGQESIHIGLEKAGELYGGETVVLIHDGVRPLIDGRTITDAIACTERRGTAITVAPAIETIVCTDEDQRVDRIVDRSSCRLARAPQCFRLGDVLKAHRQALSEGLAFIDSASLMRHYGYELYTVDGPVENIKITTGLDFYMFRSIIEARKEESGSTVPN